jgi:hypothetical protein
MRTTLTLDPDVAERIRQELATGKVSLKELVNRGLRTGLNLESVPVSGAPFRVEPHASGYKAGVDALKLNQLVDELESEEFIGSRKSSRS